MTLWSFISPEPWKGRNQGQLLVISQTIQAISRSFVDPDVPPCTGVLKPQTPFQKEEMQIPKRFVAPPESTQHIESYPVCKIAWFQNPLLFCTMDCGGGGASKPIHFFKQILLSCLTPQRKGALTHRLGLIITLLSCQPCSAPHDCLRLYGMDGGFISCFVSLASSLFFPVFPSDLYPAILVVIMS